MDSNWKRNETNKNQNRLYVFSLLRFFFILLLLLLLLLFLCHCVVALTNDNGNGNGRHSTRAHTLSQPKPIETHIKWHNWGKKLIWYFVIHWLYATDRKRPQRFAHFSVSQWFFNAGVWVHFFVCCYFFIATVKSLFINQNDDHTFQVEWKYYAGLHQNKAYSIQK